MQNPFQTNQNNNQTNNIFARGNQPNSMNPPNAFPNNSTPLFI